MRSLHEAKQFVRDHRGDKNGCICPCCEQKAMQWKKSLISTAVASLVKLVRVYKGDHIHLDEFNVVAKDRNFSQLKLWDLVRTLPSDEKRSSGMWAPTKLGVDFAKGRVNIPKYVITYNNVRIGYDKPLVGVKEILENKFNYYELLGLQGYMTTDQTFSYEQTIIFE